MWSNQSANVLKAKLEVKYPKMVIALRMIAKPEMRVRERYRAHRATGTTYK